MPTPGACASCEQLLEDDSPFQAAGLACLPLGASPVPAGKPLSLEDIPVAA